MLGGEREGDVICEHSLSTFQKYFTQVRLSPPGEGRERKEREMGKLKGVEERCSKGGGRGEGMRGLTLYMNTN